MGAGRFSAVTSQKFQSQKSKVLTCRELFARFDLSQHDRQELLELLQKDDVKAADAILREQPHVEAGKKTTLMSFPTKVVEWLTGQGTSEPINAAREAARQINDPVYVADLNEFVKQEPLLAEYAEISLQYLYTYFVAQVKNIAIKLRARVEFVQQNRYEQNLLREFNIRKTEAGTRSRIQLLEELNTVHINENT